MANKEENRSESIGCSEGGDGARTKGWKREKSTPSTYFESTTKCRKLGNTESKEQSGDFRVKDGERLNEETFEFPAPRENRLILRAKSDP